MCILIGLAHFLLWKSCFTCWTFSFLSFKACSQEQNKKSIHTKSKSLQFFKCCKCTVHMKKTSLSIQTCVHFFLLLKHKRISASYSLYDYDKRKLETPSFQKDENILKVVHMTFVISSNTIALCEEQALKRVI